MEQVDDDVSDAREEVVEAGLRRFLAKRLLQDAAQQFWDVSEILCVDPNSVERSRRDVEFIAQAYVDVGDLALGGSPAGPQGEGFEQLLGCDEQMGDWKASAAMHGKQNGAQLPDFSIWLSCCWGCMARRG